MIFIYHYKTTITNHAYGSKPFLFPPVALGLCPGMETYREVGSPTISWLVITHYDATKARESSMEHFF